MLEGLFGYINPRFSTENSGQTCRLQSQIALVVISAMPLQFSSVQFSCSIMSDSLHSHGCSTPGLLVHRQLLEFTQTHVHWAGDAIQPPHPLSSLPPPSFKLSQHQGFFKWVESVLHIRWPKYWCFSFSISPSNEYLGLIFFRMDWLDLFAVQRTLKGLSWLLVAQLS